MPRSTTTAGATVIPVTDVLVGAALVFLSVWTRRHCLGPGGFLHRRIKRDMRQQAKRRPIQQERQRQLRGKNFNHRTSSSSSNDNDKEDEDAELLHKTLVDNDKEEDAAQLDAALLQYSGGFVFGFVMLTILWFRIILKRSMVHVMMIIMAILVANVLDLTAKIWEYQEEDVMEFRRQLQQSFLPANTNECDGHDSDSSESYDPERHGNVHQHGHQHNHQQQRRGA